MQCNLVSTQLSSQLPAWVTSYRKNAGVSSFSYTQLSLFCLEKRNGIYCNSDKEKTCVPVIQQVCDVVNKGLCVGERKTASRITAVAGSRSGRLAVEESVGDG